MNYQKVFATTDSIAVLDTARTVLLGAGFDVERGDSILRASAPSILLGRHHPLVGASRIVISATDAHVTVDAKRTGALFMAAFMLVFPPLLVVGILASGRNWDYVRPGLALWVPLGVLGAAWNWYRVKLALDGFVRTIQHA